jgi:hypothetical protein
VLTSDPTRLISVPEHRPATGPREFGPADHPELGDRVVGRRVADRGPLARDAPKTRLPKPEGPWPIEDNFNDGLRIAIRRSRAVVLA